MTLQHVMDAFAASQNNPDRMKDVPRGKVYMDDQLGHQLYTSWAMISGCVDQGPENCLERDLEVYDKAADNINVFYKDSILYSCQWFDEELADKGNPLDYCFVSDWNDDTAQQAVIGSFMMSMVGSKPYWDMSHYEKMGSDLGGGFFMAFVHETGKEYDEIAAKINAVFPGFVKMFDEWPPVNELAFGKHGSISTWVFNR